MSTKMQSAFMSVSEILEVSWASFSCSLLQRIRALPILLNYSNVAKLRPLRDLNWCSGLFPQPSWILLGSVGSTVAEQDCIQQWAVGSGEWASRGAGILAALGRRWWGSCDGLDTRYLHPAGVFMLTIHSIDQGLHRCITSTGKGR